ncbi:MAG: AAA family ATPase [Gammaproteobacteria bacterium]|nr:AAA family ATPase [Gammaproteobacteria bacterium]MDE0246835.1 AAA family ATPase [Gammaproteobacteria bacterium]
MSRVKLYNVRCFGELEIDFRRPDTDPSGWNVILGDNATGKSTLLRSIAMGLCDEAGAAGLLKESDAGYIRRGSKEAEINIHLHDPRNPSKDFRITTTVRRETRGRGIYADRVRQTTDPPRAAFPWHTLFVSGYGAGRGVTGTGDISSYSVLDAVYNMFNYTEGLQNPELVIRRLSASTPTPNRIPRQISNLLQSAMHTDEIRLSSNGIRVSGPWGRGMPLRDLADGYKSSFLWITDLLGWALAFNPRRKSAKGIRGIVLIDELEQHLHARWQRTAVDDLRDSFPNVQFIASTHSPLIASSIGPPLQTKVADRLYVLESHGRKGVKAEEHEFMRGLTMDQVLASRAFKYQIQASPSTESMLRAVSSIGDTIERTPEQEEVFDEVKEKLKYAFLSGMSPIERISQLEAETELIERINSLINEKDNTGDN